MQAFICRVLDPLSCRIRVQSLQLIRCVVIEEPFLKNRIGPSIWEALKWNFRTEFSVSPFLFLPVWHVQNSTIGYALLYHSCCTGFTKLLVFEESLPDLTLALESRKQGTENGGIFESLGRTLGSTGCISDLTYRFGESWKTSLTGRDALDGKHRRAKQRHSSDVSMFPSHC